METNYSEKYGTDAQWVSDQIDAWWASNNTTDEEGYERFECLSDVRLARKGDLEEEQAYEDAMSCCGQMDVEFGPSPLGYTYMYGFNYGH